MEYCSGIVKDINIAYIGGGSRGWAWTFMSDLARENELSGTVRLYDTDMAAAHANETIGNSLKNRNDAPGHFEYIAVRALEEALCGADFVIISILPGSFDDMEADVHMPERLGIYQSVGDTAGPGGMMRAMRALPMFREFAEAIKAFCPDAWVINYTNPMSLCVKTLYHVFPGIKAFGCCHEVFGTQKVLGAIASQELGTGPIERQDICVNVLGINHFTWFDYAAYKGTDLFPVYRAYINKHFEEGFNEPDNSWADSSFACAHRVKMDLFMRFGLIAAAGDRHLAEFMPGDMYLKDPETVRSWKFGLTSVAWRKEDLKRRLARSKRLMDGEERLELKDTGEEGVKLLKALCGLGRTISNVNIPNTCGQIGNLPGKAVVETNALFERDAVRPLHAGVLPDNVLNLIMPHVKNHERVLKAALNRDFGLLYEAFLTDPLIKGRAPEKDIKALMDDMLKAALRT